MILILYLYHIFIRFTYLFHFRTAVLVSHPMNRQQELLAGNSAVNYEKFETWARAGPKDTPAEQGTGAGKNGDLMGFVWILYIYI